MYFGLSEEQESIQDFVKKFLADNSTVDEIRKIANGEGEELEKFKELKQTRISKEMLGSIILKYNYSVENIFMMILNKN